MPANGRWDLIRPLKVKFTRNSFRFNAHNAKSNYLLHV